MITWDKTTQEKFNQLIDKMPVFLRAIAKQKVSEKAKSLVKEEDRSEITEKDMVDAFFAETPFGFQGLMKADLETLGVDYTKYGHAK